MSAAAAPKLLMPKDLYAQMAAKVKSTASSEMSSPFAIRALSHFQLTKELASAHEDVKVLREALIKPRKEAPKPAEPAPKPAEPAPAPKPAPKPKPTAATGGAGVAPAVVSKASAQKALKPLRATIAAIEEEEKQAKAKGEPLAVIREIQQRRSDASTALLDREREIRDARRAELFAKLGSQAKEGVLAAKAKALKLDERVIHSITVVEERVAEGKYGVESYYDLIMLLAKPLTEQPIAFLRTMAAGMNYSPLRPGAEIRQTFVPSKASKEELVDYLHTLGLPR